MKKSVVTILSVSIVLGMLSSVIAAQSRSRTGACVPVKATVSRHRVSAAVPEDRYLNGSYSLPVLRKRIGLTKEQESKMRLLYTGFSDRTRASAKELLSSTSEKRAMLKSGKIDQQKLAKLDDEILKARSGISAERLKLVRDRLALLTSPQVKRLASLGHERIMQAQLNHGHTKIASKKRC
jgi:hypothetical protein